MEPKETLSPKEYAKRLGVSETKVLAWIRAGELAAINVAANLKNRPRYRITAEAREAFEARRTTQAAATATRTRRPSYARYV
jgi:excisionase family DNA binding protein